MTTHAWMRVVGRRPPADSLDRVRLAFLGFSLGSAALILGVLLHQPSAGTAARPVGTAALVVLAWKWLADYRRGGHGLAWDLLEAAVLLGLGVAVGDPLVILLLLYARLSASALEHGTRAVVASTAAYALAYAGAAALSALRGANPAPPVEQLFLGSGIPLAAAIMRMLGQLFDRLAASTERERLLAAEAGRLDEQLRRQMARELRAVEANFSRLFDSNPQPMWVHDERSGSFLAVNDAAVHLYGHDRDAFLAMRVGDLDDAPAGGHPDADAERAPGSIDVVRGRRHRTREGRSIQVETTSHRLQFGDRPAVFVMARDVTEEVDLQAQLRRQAFHDPLTDLPNRALLDDRTTQALRRARRRAARRPVMLVLDLDGFKAVNDTVGHAAGDAAIRTVAERITACLRPGDTAARLGGDEFAVLLDEPGGIAEAEMVAQRLIERIQAPCTVAGRTVSLSACAGIAECVDPERGLSGMLSDADTAMYVAKARGRGTYQVFTTEVRSAHLERRRMQENLAGAVRNTELRVVYQPQVDLASRRVTGVEALARWYHPVHGEVPPDVFVTTAEELGLVTDIDLWVLRTACADVCRWRDAGFGIQRVAVNISGRDLDRATLVDDVRRALVENMLDPWQVELELTEGVAVRQHETAVARLEALRALGIRIGIDDFGTGYSMFSRLRDLPIDRLKIDRSFVRDLAHDDDTAAIVASTVAMGHALGLTLVAEGVETEAALLRLAELGCDTAQGFHICHPLPAEELVEWLAASAWAAPVLTTLG